LYLQTREELRDALENEMRAFQRDKDLGQNVEISWNYTEFEVFYFFCSHDFYFNNSPKVVEQ